MALSRGIADSCALIVFLARPDAAQVMPNAYPIMRSGEVYVSPMVVWEITRKITIGKLPPMPSGVPPLLQWHGFRFLPLTWEEAADAANLPTRHKDPVDRFLVAHARHHGLPILSSDTVIPSYGVTTIW